MGLSSRIKEDLRTHNFDRFRWLKNFYSDEVIDSFEPYICGDCGYESTFEQLDALENTYKFMIGYVLNNSGKFPNPKKQRKEGFNFLWNLQIAIRNRSFYADAPPELVEKAKELQDLMNYTTELSEKAAEITDLTGAVLDESYKYMVCILKKEGVEEQYLVD